MRVVGSPFAVHVVTDHLAGIDVNHAASEASVCIKELEVRGRLGHAVNIHVLDGVATREARAAVESVVEDVEGRREVRVHIADDDNVADIGGGALQPENPPLSTMLSSVGPEYVASPIDWRVPRAGAALAPMMRPAAVAMMSDLRPVIVKEE